MPNPLPPGLRELQRSAAVFNGFNNVDGSWHRLGELTGSALGLDRAEHRAALVRWLNSWGCRLRYPRPGEPDTLGSGLASWWASWSDELPASSLLSLRDNEIDTLARAYHDLSLLPVRIGRGGRTLGPTAASKALYAMRPAGVLPWDAAIAEHLHGGRGADSYAAHLRLGRSWAAALLESADVTEQSAPALIGRPAVSLAKVLDEHLYVTITLGRGSTVAIAGAVAGE